MSKKKDEYKPQKRSPKSQTPWDGKQFVVGVEDKEKNLYKDKNEYDVYGQAKEAADAWAERTGQRTIVFDRNSSEGIVYRAPPVDDGVIKEDDILKKKSKK